MKKKPNTFAKWQETKVSSREGKIVQYLTVLKKAKFKNITKLAESIAKLVSKDEESKDEDRPRPCNTATLLRNPRYKSLLVSFLANQAGVVNVSTLELSDDRAKAVVMSLQLEVGNLKEENKRLRTYIQHLDADVDVDTLKSSRSLPKLPNQANENEFVGEDVLTLSNLLSQACKAIWLMLVHFDQFVSADASGRCIVDLSEIGDKRIVVDSTTAAPFFEWLRNNDSIRK